MVNTTQQVTLGRQVARQVDKVVTHVGYLSPTSGTQTVLTASGIPLQLPTGAIILGGSIAPYQTALVGGTNVQFGTAATSGGAVATNLGAPFTPAMTSGTVFGNVAVPVGQTYVSGTSTGTFTAGKVKIILTFLNPFSQ